MSVTVGATSVIEIVIELGVGGRAVRGPHDEVVARRRLPVELVVSATVMAPVEAPMANTPSSLPESVDQVRLVVSPVVETVTTAALTAAVSARLADVSVTVGATSNTEIVISSVSVWLPLSVAWTVSV